MKIKEVWLIIFIIASIIINCNISECQESYNHDILFINKFIKTVIDEDVNNLVKYFDENISVSEVILVFSSQSINGYDGFQNKYGPLYSVFFNMKQLKGNQKMILYNSYETLKFILKDKNNYTYDFNTDIPQIAAMYKNKNYHIFFRKTSSNHYRITGIQYSNNQQNIKW